MYLLEIDAAVAVLVERVDDQLDVLLGELRILPGDPHEEGVELGVRELPVSVALVVPHLAVGPAVSRVLTVSIGNTTRFVTAAATPPPIKLAAFTALGVALVLSARENIVLFVLPALSPCPSPLAPRAAAFLNVGVRGGLCARQSI